MRRVVTKYSGNPILTNKDCPWPAECVYNAGVARYKGKYILMPRCLGLDGNCTFGLAESSDGYHFVMRDKPVISKATEGEFSMYENRGVEDARITQFGDTYYIFYSCFSNFGFRIGLIQTDDFEDFRRIAITTTTDYRNSVLFPEKINGLYCRLDRPNNDPWGIWISYSPDLIHWGQSKLIQVPYPLSIWEYHKTGPGAPPIKTDNYWLSIYHATTHTMDGQTYRLGVMLHDLEDPSRVIVARQFILSPEEIHERVGYVHNVVFTNGALAEPDGTLKIYYGGADTNMNVATAKIQDLIDICLEDSRPALG